MDKVLQFNLTIFISGKYSVSGLQKKLEIIKKEVYNRKKFLSVVEWVVKKSGSFEILLDDMLVIQKRKNWILII